MDNKMDFITFYLVLFFYGVTLCYGQDTFYFNVKPTNQKVVEGKELTLRCDVSNRRHISFQWIQDNKPVVNTSRRFQDGSDLRILRVTREEDKGPFQCIATNVTTGFSLQSGEATLDIYWIEPEAKVELKRVKEEDVALGMDIQLKCQINGHPEPDFSWYQNQFRIFTRDNVKIMDKGSRLRISSLKASDNGVYSCRAENVAGNIDSTENFLLNVPAPNTPHLIEDEFTPYKLVMKNAAAWLDCPFVNATKIEWFANYEKLSNSSRHTIYNNGSLYFPKVRKMDEAAYRCEGLSKHPDVAAQTFTAELVISYLNDVTLHSFEPRLIPNFPMVMSLDKEFMIKAFLPDGKPKPSYKWFNKNDMTVGDTGPIRTVGPNLFFEQPQEIDSGNYTLIINNTAGEKRQNVWIIVSVPPRINRGPQAKEVSEGASVDFRCQVTGTAYPVTTVMWRKDKDFIKLGSWRHKINEEAGTLVIEEVRAEDQGYYTCIANTTGQDLVVSAFALLKVKKKLKFNPVPQNTPLELDSDAEVHCNAEAEIHPQIHWIKGTSWQNGASLDFSSHIIDAEGTLYFRGVKRSDAGYYTCVAHVTNGLSQQLINRTIYIEVVERPKFRIRPVNMTAYEEHSTMLHCVASGDPRPTITWDKNRVIDNWDPKRFKFYPNGTLLISKVYMEDQGLYGCTANNSAGAIHTYAYLYVASGSEYTEMNQRDDEEGFDMMRTVIIVVCSAGAYLALVIGLTAYCSYRLLVQRRNRKNMIKTEKPNGNLSQEQHELLMKDRDRDSAQCRSDSDNRSHVSALSSHPSHSSHSNSQTQSQNLSHQSQRSVGKSSIERLYYPRHELQTLGMLGKSMFGDVLLAKAHGIRQGEAESQVVVKSLLSKEDNHYYEFQREIEIYTRLDHNNLVKVLAVSREMEPQLYIIEHCDWGDLKQFLLASRTDNNGRRLQRIPPLTVIQKIGMCNQVALGMEHMSNNRFVHRDLAARNVLLTSRLELKISHMCLARDVYASEYVLMSNQTALPLRWLSPEAAMEADYSLKSDIWAFGVFMWEVMHLGDLPHKNRSDEELLKGLKAGDITLEFSEHSPNEMIDLVRKCTAESPKDRPSFSEVCNAIADLVTIYSQPTLGSSTPSVMTYPGMQTPIYQTPGLPMYT